MKLEERRRAPAPDESERPAPSISPTHRGRRLDLLAADLVLTLVLLAVTLGYYLIQRVEGFITAGGTVGFRVPDLLGSVLLVVGVAPLVWRRRSPLVVLALSGAALSLYYGQGYAPSTMGFATLIAAYTVAVLRPPLTSIAAVGPIVGAVSVALVMNPASIPNDIVAALLAFAAAWSFGYGQRNRRAHMSMLEARANVLERDREERARLAVAGERARIARELHDVVSHSMTVVVAQAGAARRVFDGHPHEARHALASIETAGRQALGEMRRLLGIDARDRAPDDRPTPQPTLERLEDLVRKVREAGVPVEVTIDGEVRELPPGLNLSAYRVVQEALTNVLKHAGPARATVGIRYAPQTLEIMVADDGRGSARGLEQRPGQGFGLLGMRERVELFGGQLRAGPKPGGGYEVRAWLPVDPLPQP